MAETATLGDTMRFESRCRWHIAILAVCLLGCSRSRVSHVVTVSYLEPPDPSAAAVHAAAIAVAWDRFERGAFEQACPVGESLATGAAAAHDRPGGALAAEVPAF